MVSDGLRTGWLIALSWVSKVGVCLTARPNPTGAEASFPAPAECKCMLPCQTWSHSRVTQHQTHDPGVLTQLHIANLLQHVATSFRLRKFFQHFCQVETHFYISSQVLHAVLRRPLACSVRRTPRAVPHPAVARAPVLQIVITRAPPSRPAACQPKHPKQCVEKCQNRSLRISAFKPFLKKPFLDPWIAFKPLSLSDTFLSFIFLHFPFQLPFQESKELSWPRGWHLHQHHQWPANLDPKRPAKVTCSRYVHLQGEGKERSPHFSFPDPSYPRIKRPLSNHYGCQ